MMTGPTPDRDHLFVSYAWEDVALAEWLVYKLTHFGYKVWCDRIKLFGGESFPLEIDDAIKNRTHRLLAILSPASLSKPNPTKERTLALHIARERKCDFMIPVNLGVRPVDLNWMISDLTYVDFQNNWAEGLSQLLKAIGKAGTPRPLADGSERVVASIIPPELLLPGTEQVYTNLLRVLSIPDVLTTYQFYCGPKSDERERMGREWAGYRIDDKRFVAFQPPPSHDDFWKHKVVDADRWREKETIQGVTSRNIVSHLLKKALRVLCLSKGMQVTERGDWLHIPSGVVKGDRLGFLGLDGKSTWVSVKGSKGFFRPGKEIEGFHYYLSPSFVIRRDLGEEFTVVMSIRVHVTDSKGKTYPPRSAQARRKAATNSWYNWEWGNRHLAVACFLSDGKPEIAVGTKPQEVIRFSAVPLSVTSHLAIHDAEVARRRKQRSKSLEEGTE
jgi:hypothetical protein